MGGNSGDLAKEAEAHATAASTAAATAKAASDKAEAAAGVTGAVEARIAAEAAKTLAEAKQGEAEARRDAAVAAAATELKIDADTRKIYTRKIDADTRSVVGTSIMIGAKPDSRTVDGVTTKTGKQFDIIERSKEEPGLKDDLNTNDDERKPAVAPREIIVGDVYDSADDTARVALVTRYIGSKTVGAYLQLWDDVTSEVIRTGSTSNLINHDRNDDTRELVLTAESGTFYKSSGGVNEDGVTILSMRCRYDPYALLL